MGLLNIFFHLLIGSIIRLIFIIYGIWQDSNFKVKYTDVDYEVFTDAAKYISQGQSPFNRATYRYTPILAWMLYPNVTLHHAFGKLLFSFFDIMSGFLMFKLIRMKHSNKCAVLCALLWLYNPLSIGVSTRGNAESLLAFVILLTFFLFTRKSSIMFCLSCVIYGFSVHMKIYPITYSLPLYLMLSGYSQTNDEPMWRRVICPNKNQCLLVILSISSFLGFTFLCYHFYGEEFINEAYLYHITRRDTRHNFSVYFYLMYLSAGSSYSLSLGLLTFLPQALLLLASSFKFYTDLPFCCFMNTFIFVTFNKVCTSQYFLWYLCLLPLIIPSLQFSYKRAIVLAVAWFAGQALWLYPAYLLEFEGQNTFVLIWWASIIFFLINILIMYNIVKYYHIVEFPTHSIQRAHDVDTQETKKKL